MRAGEVGGGTGRYGGDEEGEKGDADDLHRWLLGWETGAPGVTPRSRKLAP